MLQISGRPAPFRAEAVLGARNMRHTNDEMPAGSLLIIANGGGPAKGRLTGLTVRAEGWAIRRTLRHVVDFVGIIWVDGP